jgi:hypothetical protein
MAGEQDDRMRRGQEERGREERERDEGEDGGA